MSGPAADSLSQSVASAINRAAGGRPVPGNHVELLIDGPDTYDAMLDLIARASRWIHFENYIIRSDAEHLAFAQDRRLVEEPALHTPRWADVHVRRHLLDRQLTDDERESSTDLDRPAEGGAQQPRGVR